MIVSQDTFFKELEVKGNVLGVSQGRGRRTVELSSGKAISIPVSLDIDVGDVVNKNRDSYNLFVNGVQVLDEKPFMERQARAKLGRQVFYAVCGIWIAALSAWILCQIWIRRAGRKLA